MRVTCVSTENDKTLHLRVVSFVDFLFTNVVASLPHIILVVS